MLEGRDRVRSGLGRDDDWKRNGRPVVVVHAGKVLGEAREAAGRQFRLTNGLLGG
jgi:hypothetical protein